MLPALFHLTMITQAVLPIAGLGTRFLPWTKSVPKEMLPIGTRPIIALIVDECLGVGIRDICFVLSHGKEAISHYFSKDALFEAELRKRGKMNLIEELAKYDEVRFHVVYQEEQLGDGHAILQASGWVESEEVAVLFGDDLFMGKETGLQQLLKGFEQSASDGERAVIALENISRERTSSYGIVEVEREHPQMARLKKLKGLVEKPQPEKAPSTLGIVGRYLIPRSTFSVLPSVRSGTKDGEIRLIDALIKQLSSITMFGYECEGTRLDTGTPEGYRAAIGRFGSF
jgi:UTP--glucose-1-phosphate uridylyltransferase